MTFDFSLTEDQASAGAHVIAVAGEVDIFTAPELKRAIAAAIDGGARRLVVDLTETRFLDSTALGVLIGAVKRLRPLEGRLVIVNTEPSTAKTFEITGLDQIFTIVAARDDALESVAAD
ncbi:MAG: anti-sigma factor antagonist [Solirubrobacteraceae bacterium]|jgi:anti-sigma B factor antagonist|nr:anti-sigma factor antagonist [Solirubrobacteraceae bacterium]